MNSTQVSEEFREELIDGLYQFVLDVADGLYDDLIEEDQEDQS